MPQAPSPQAPTFVRTQIPAVPDPADPAVAVPAVAVSTPAVPATSVAVPVPVAASVPAPAPLAADPPSVAESRPGRWGPRRALWTGVTVALLAFVLMGWLEVGGKLDPLDEAVTGSVAHAAAKWSWVQPLGVALSLPGTWLAAALTACLAATLCMRFRQPPLALACLASAVTAFSGNATLKPLFHRTRPAFGTELGWSFPSGHTLTATAAYGACLILVAQAWILHRGLDGAQARPVWRAALAGWAALALLTGTGRVVAMHHWLGDVMASWALGIAVVGALLLVAGVPRHALSPPVDPS